jgi:hypothetical protein
MTRQQFIVKALLPAANNGKPQMPFAPPGGNLHLILGAGLDLRDDIVPGTKTSLGEVAGLDWVDLLDPPDQLPSGGRAVVIGNLDLALQVPATESGQNSEEEWKTDDSAPDPLERVYRTIRMLAGSAGARDAGGRHVFLLAEIDPLDRISLLWQQQGTRKKRLVEGWRWAELIQDFTMFPIRLGGPIEAKKGDARILRTIREELGVLDTSFAHQMRDQLVKKMAASDADRPDKEERIVSFISEQMSDHYHKLWTSSSDEERVMLYHIASDSHLKMHESLALRSLLARGLLIRVPEYRLMNRSFTRYVLRIGAPSELQERARDLGGIDRIWPLIRYPIAAIAGASVLLLQFVAPSTGSAAVGALPALLALVPTLLGRWFQDRGAAT